MVLISVSPSNTLNTRLISVWFMLLIVLRTVAVINSSQYYLPLSPEAEKVYQFYKQAYSPGTLKASSRIREKTTWITLKLLVLCVPLFKLFLKLQAQVFKMSQDFFFLNSPNEETIKKEKSSGENLKSNLCRFWTASAMDTKTAKQKPKQAEGEEQVSSS